MFAVKAVHIILAFVIMFFGATSLFWVGRWSETLPAGWPNYAIHAGPFHWSLHLPDSLGAQRDAARAELKTCHGNTVTLSTALDHQNAAVAALKVAGDQLTANAAKAVQQAHTASLGLNKRASVLISTPPAGADVCARAIDAFERVRGDLAR